MVYFDWIPSSYESAVWNREGQTYLQNRTRVPKMVKKTPNDKEEVACHMDFLLATMAMVEEEEEEMPMQSEATLSHSIGDQIVRYPPYHRLEL